MRLPRILGQKSVRVTASVAGAIASVWVSHLMGWNPIPGLIIMVGIVAAGPNG